MLSIYSRLQRNNIIYHCITYMNLLRSVQLAHYLHITLGENVRVLLVFRAAVISYSSG